MAEPLIKVQRLCFAYNGQPVLQNIDLQVQQGERWAIIGRNGAGKSTLIKCIAGLERGFGTIQIKGTPLSRMSSRERARIMAYVPQVRSAVIPYTVYDYVMMGRFAFQGVMALPSKTDRKLVAEALELTDTGAFADRPLYALSGGEQQRVILAGAVSQQPAILLLDEPASFLDPRHRLMMVQALGRIHDEYGTTLMTVTHDVNISITKYDNTLALKNGMELYKGSSAGLYEKSPELLERIYGVAFESAVVGNTNHYYFPAGMEQ